MPKALPVTQPTMSELKEAQNTDLSQRKSPSSFIFSLSTTGGVFYSFYSSSLMPLPYNIPSHLFPQFGITVHIHIGNVFVTFHVRRSQNEMYIGHSRLCVCLSLAAFPHCCTDPDVTWGNGRGCPIVVHYWADLQSVHGFHYCDNIAPM